MQIEVDQDKLAAIVKAIEDGDGDAALAIVKAIITGAPADGATPPADAAPENADTPPVAAGETPVATARLDAASGAVLMRLTGCATEAEALAQYKSMQDRVVALDKTQAGIELNTRRGLIVELITLGVETPALAWLGKTDEERAKRTPCKRLAGEPIEEMSARVATLKRIRPAAPLPPEGGGPDDAPDVAAEVAKLRPAELKKIKDSGMTPEQFIAAKRAAVRRI